MDYLLKTEPSDYSFADLRRDQTTDWSGVRNPQAVKHLREMRAGDRLVIYHTGDEKRAVGLATVAAVDAGDPKNPRVTITAGEPLPVPVTLAQIKGDRRFAQSPLLAQGRLSVVPLTAGQYARLCGGK